MKLLFEKSNPGLVNDYLPDCALPLDPALCRKTPPKLPEIAENELARHYTQLAGRTRGVNGGFYPLGSCSM